MGNLADWNLKQSENKVKEKRLNVVEANGHLGTGNIMRRWGREGFRSWEKWLADRYRQREGGAREGLWRKRSDAVRKTGHTG